MKIYKYSFFELIKKINYKISNPINSLISNVYHSITFKIHDIGYVELPTIKGRLIIKNEGKCILGNKLNLIAH